jgi:DNA-binding response OmpR family regulator
MRTKRRILLLEDDRLFLETIEEFLEEDYHLDTACTGEQALSLCYENLYDLYLCDINVPDVNGLDFLKALRQNNDTTPAIFITSHKDQETIAQAFQNGCDDYMRKPFDLFELKLRIEAILNRTLKTPQNSNHTYLSDTIYYDKKQRRVFENNKDLNLQFKVILLLELFLQNDQKIVTKEQIINALWSPSEEYSEGSIRLYINKVRQILKKDALANIKGYGYKIRIF